MPEISKARVPDPRSRLARLEQLPWWSTAAIHEARVGVVGVGAIGNELLKFLALLDFRHVRIFDRDLVEISNLSRGVLLSERDAGIPKVIACESSLLRLNPDLDVQAFHGDVMLDVGLGYFRDLDVVLAGLDARAPRLWLNEHVRALGVPWVDGATGGSDGLHGTAMTYLPDTGPCYECTMTEADWTLLDEVDRCGSRDRSKMYQGTVATTPMGSSITAAAQIHQALTLLTADRPPTGFEYDLNVGIAFPSKYERRPDCRQHFTIGEIVESGISARHGTLNDLIAQSEGTVGSPAALVTRWKVVTAAECPGCGHTLEIWQPSTRVTEKDLTCNCGSQMHETSEFEFYAEDYGARTLNQLTIPSHDIVEVQGPRGTCYIQLADEHLVDEGRRVSAGLTR